MIGHPIIRLPVTYECDQQFHAFPAQEVRHTSLQMRLPMILPLTIVTWWDRLMLMKRSGRRVLWERRCMHTIPTHLCQTTSFDTYLDEINQWTAVRCRVGYLESHIHMQKRTSWKTHMWAGGSRCRSHDFRSTCQQSPASCFIHRVGSTAKGRETTRHDSLIYNHLVTAQLS